MATGALTRDGVTVDKPDRSAVTIVAITISALLGLALLWKFLPMNDYLRQAIEWVEETGPLGALSFVLIYVLAALVGIPRTILNVAAGVLFSFPVALGSVLVGAATAYFLTFTIARTVAQDWVKRRVAQAPNVKRLLDLVDQEGFRLVLLIRMNPLIPGVLKGYGFGTTNIPLRTYLGASILGFLPIAAMHVYLGWAGGEAVLRDNGSMSGPEKWLLIGGVVLSLVLVAGIYRYGKRAMDRRYARELPA